MNDKTTLIGDSIVVSGALTGDEDLTVEGRIEGTIQLSKTLFIEESGIVKAQVDVRNAVVSGIVVGDIVASESVEITPTGRMVGDITAPSVLLLEGARFSGRIDMGDMDSPRVSVPSHSRAATPRTGQSRAVLGEATATIAATIAATRAATGSRSSTAKKTVRVAARPSAGPAKTKAAATKASGKGSKATRKKKVKKKIVVKRRR